MAEATIYTGFWIDWSKDRFLGATLTTTAAQGRFLVAFVAIFVSTAGGSLWQIINYGIHRSRFTDEAHDGLFYQQQVILRNALSPSVAAWKQLELSWFWRSRAQRGGTRPIPYLFLALLYLVSLGMTSVFSSSVAQSTSAVLLRSPICGYLDEEKDYPDGDDPDLQQADGLGLSASNTYRCEKSLTYVQACVNTSSELPSIGNCGIYGGNPLAKMTVSKESCPFAEGTCLDPEHGVIGLDTGLLDTNADLGLNMRDSLFVRKTTVCAPVQTQDYMTHYLNASDPIYNGSYEYSYGLPIWEDEPSTFSIDPVQQQYLARKNGDFPAYQLHPAAAFAGDSTEKSDFVATGKLNRTDADVMLMFLVNNVFYSDAVHDLWFNSSDAAPDLIAYFRNAPQVSVLGCTEQYQFCRSRNDMKDCTSKQGRERIENNQLLKNLDLNEAQFALASHLVRVLGSADLRTLVELLGATMLNANSNLALNNAYSAPLPDNQWQIEAIRFGQVGHIALRQALIDFAAGPPSQSWNTFVLSPDPDSVVQSFCSAQKVYTTEYTSFNVLGLSIIFLVGGVLIILDLVLSLLVGLLARVRGYTNPYDPWLQDDPLHLQQRAFEQSGLGTWQGQDTSVPVTEPGQKMRPPWYMSPLPQVNRLIGGTSEQTDASNVEDNDESVPLRPIASRSGFSKECLSREDQEIDYMERYISP